MIIKTKNLLTFMIATTNTAQIFNLVIAFGTIFEDHSCIFI